jgi:integrase
VINFSRLNDDAITQADAHKFCDWLGRRLRPVTMRERIASLRSCWKWAVDRNYLSANPWLAVKIRVPRTQKKPSTLDEIK